MAIHQQQPMDSVKTPASRSQATQRIEQGLEISKQPRAPLTPEHAAPDEILMLQRAVGNHAVSGLIQAKLRVGPVGDLYEQEADRVAEQVMRVPALDSAASVQRQGTPEEEELQMKPLAATITPVVQRQEDEEELQMKALPATANPVVQRQEEEELQMKSLAATNTPVVQRQEDEEELQMKALPATANPVIQRQEEEELQMKSLAATNTPVIQRQEDEEELQMKPLPATANPVVQRQEDEEELQMKPLATATTPVVQRQEEEEELQMKPLGRGGFQASDDVERQLRFRRGAGSPLPANLRTEMEARFGVSFDAVRLHTDREAGQLNKDLRARAFTHGTNIYLGTNEPDVATGEGKRLLAHELTHVVQQTGGGAPDATPSSTTHSNGNTTVQRNGGNEEEDPYHDPYHPTMSPLVNKRPPDEPAQTEEDPYHEPYHPTMSPLVNKRPPDEPAQTEKDPYHEPYHPTMSPLVNKRPPDSSSTPTPSTPSKWKRFKGRFSPGMKRRLFPDLSVPAALRTRGTGTSGGLLQGPGVGERPALSTRPESEGGRTWQQGFDEPEKKGDSDIDKQIAKLEAQLEMLKLLKGGD